MQHRRPRACQEHSSDHAYAAAALCPRSCRRVELNHGCHVFPDTAAMERGENPQWLYTVVFDGRDLWGEDGDPTLKVSIDAFEPYLDPA
ncbi:SH3-like domain-containing protein [Bradyrhizobium sp. DASA03076]|uniref:SH3-like domain-containing protein n=1 Tax=Bradyrhizobium sp. BLXBL-03 TaxID=3395916 RepID=UPI003F7257DD